MMGLQVGFLVAFTQLIPEHQVQIFGGLLKVRVKVSHYIPLVLNPTLAVYQLIHIPILPN